MNMRENTLILILTTNNCALLHTQCTTDAKHAPEVRLRKLTMLAPCRLVLGPCVYIFNPSLKRSKNYPSKNRVLCSEKKKCDLLEPGDKKMQTPDRG